MPQRSSANRRRPLTVEALESRVLLDGAPLITEFMALNDRTLADHEGDFADWIELHNAADEVVNLDGWYLTDDARDLTRWRFPSVTLEPRGYLVVFASGKNLSDPLRPLHTSFKLAGEGEFLALVEPDGRTIRHSFAPVFPEQTPDVSYGFSADMATPLYFDQPTPGAANGDGLVGLASAPATSEQHGMFTTPFELSLASNTPDAEIRYTLDGSVPRSDSGQVYRGPISIDRTTILRAAAFKPDYLASKVVTQTYLFLENVLTQSRPAGYPDLLAGDYGVVPSAVAAHRETILDDLRAVPSISLVTSVDDMFGPQGVYTLGEDRPASVELIYADGRAGFQVDAALRQQGGASRSTTVPKHAFRVRFTSDYGPTKLNYPLFSDSDVTEFDTFILRAGLQDGWQGGQTGQNQYIKDEFARRTQLAMGQPSAHGNWVHVYVNGLYWGMYNLTERPDASFASAYMGGDKDDWDVLNAGRIRDGNTAAWDQMLALTPRGGPDLPSFDAQRVAENYEAIQQYLDVSGFIDYLVIGSYMSTIDWLPNNYYVGRRSRDGDQLVDPADDAGRFRFFHWDQEASFLDAESFRGPPGFGNPVGRIFQLLKLSPDFRQTVGQRLYESFYNGGPLSLEACVERYQQLMDEVRQAIKGEAIRWGAGANNVRDWEAEGQFLINTLLPGRRDGILNQYRRLGLYPTIDAPVFSQHGGRILAGELLGMTATDAQIYYTLDGSDPRAADGSVAPGALLYSDPISLPGDAQVRARALADNEWSAYNHAQFILVRSAGPGDFNVDGMVDAADIDLLSQQIRSASTDAAFDLNGDQRVDRADHVMLIRDILQTRPGDSNLDHLFDTADLLAVLQSGAYEQEIEAGWQAGDWNGDGVFNTEDLVLAFQAG